MIALPRVIAGTSFLGNLYTELSFSQKKEIIQAYTEASGTPAVFDTAGKYGAGLALETLGRCLQETGMQQEDVIISNKLAWMRMPLQGSEPTFEPGVWKNLKHDATQNISYQGILDCFRQGNELLRDYTAQLASVHDPDEYLAAAKDEADEQKRYDDILDAYRALHDLKKEGLISGIGIGSKTWTTIRRICADVSLDWVMLANSLTIFHHPPELLSFVAELNEKKITIINSAVFHGGFLTGGNYFNYRLLSEANEDDAALFGWRKDFYQLCENFSVKPPEACISFALQVPGITSIALSSTSPHRTRQNVAMTQVDIPSSFWQAMKDNGLISHEYPYL